MSLTENRDWEKAVLIVTNLGIFADSLGRRWYGSSQQLTEARAIIFTHFMGFVVIRASFGTCCIEKGKLKIHVVTLSSLLRDCHFFKIHGGWHVRCDVPDGQLAKPGTGQSEHVAAWLVDVLVHPRLHLVLCQEGHVPRVSHSQVYLKLTIWKFKRVNSFQIEFWKWECLQFQTVVDFYDAPDRKLFEWGRLWETGYLWTDF